MDDRALVELQIGRPPRALRRVAVRCPFGAPAVTEQSPYGSDEQPFPTTYYLTCPQLVAAIARLEAGGGVERWSRAAARDPVLAASLEQADRHQRRVRRELAEGRESPSLELGIAGSSSRGSLKCLHAHAAWALVHPEYELGRRILAEVEQLWPGSCCTIHD